MKERFMALITCPECKKKISDTANSCPNCGYKLTPEKVHEIKKKEKATNPLALGCLFLIAIIFIFYQLDFFSTSDTSKPKIESPKTQEEIRTEQIEKHFSAWDGSHRGLTQLIKESMNDPDSYEHVEPVYWDHGDYLTVKITFRGKNAFGGVVTNQIVANVDLQGNVIEVLSRNN